MSDLKKFLAGVLSFDYPYTNDELLRLAKSQGFKAKAADVKAAVTDIAADIRAGSPRLSLRGAEQESTMAKASATGKADRAARRGARVESYRRGERVPPHESTHRCTTCGRPHLPSEHRDHAAPEKRRIDRQRSRPEDVAILAGIKRAIERHGYAQNDEAARRMLADGLNDDTLEWTTVGSRLGRDSGFAKKYGLHKKEVPLGHTPAAIVAQQMGYNRPGDVPNSRLDEFARRLEELQGQRKEGRSRR